MRVQFRRSGGFAGLRVDKVIDSGKLPPAEAGELGRLVEASGFFDLPPSIRSPRGADMFQYNIIIEDGGRKHSIEVDDGAAPPELKPLLTWLNSAKPTG